MVLEEAEMSWKSIMQANLAMFIRSISTLFILSSFPPALVKHLKDEMLSLISFRSNTYYIHVYMTTNEMKELH